MKNCVRHGRRAAKRGAARAAGRRLGVAAEWQGGGAVLWYTGAGRRVPGSQRWLRFVRTTCGAT